MKRFLVLFAVVAAVAATVAACGAKSSASTLPSAGSTTVAVKRVPGFGAILVTASGMPLYVNDQDRVGMPACNGACAVVWPALTVKGAPTQSGVTAKLGVVKRSDGTSQVTANGRPLYTFLPDNGKGGQVTGNGIHDQYGSQTFSWHVVLSNGTAASTTASSAGSSSGGGSSGSGSSGGASGGATGGGLHY